MTPAEFYEIGSNKPFYTVEDGESCLLADDKGEIEGTPYGFDHTILENDQQFVQSFGKEHTHKSEIISGNPDILVVARKKSSS